MISVKDHVRTIKRHINGNMNISCQKETLKVNVSARVGRGGDHQDGGQHQRARHELRPGSASLS